MLKIFLLTLLIVQLSLACHPSCSCMQDSAICLSCIDENSTMDFHQRSCYCKSGYFTYQLYPNFQCDSTSLIMDSCKQEIGLKSKNVIVNTNCHYETIDNNNYVVSNVSLDTHAVSFNPDCLDAFRTKVQYKPAGAVSSDNEDLLYIDVESQHITEDLHGAKKLQWKLIDIYSIAYQSQINAEQISQVVKLRILIGHESKFVRVHNWDLIVFTNRNQVQVFEVNVDMERSSGCQTGQDCIVIADLDTVGKVYQDKDYSKEQLNFSNYKVGDIFYAKISFIDSTFTKKLIFQNLFYKNSENEVFDFSQITDHRWVGDGLTIALPLIEPTAQAKIQVNMLIEQDRRIRRLPSTSTTYKNPLLSFTLVVNKTQKQDGSLQTNNDNNNNASASSHQLVFILLSSLTLLFLF